MNPGAQLCSGMVESRRAGRASKDRPLALRSICALFNLKRTWIGDSGRVVAVDPMTEG